MVASLNLHAANTGSPTFVRGASETHIDISFVSDAIVQRLGNWRVLMEVESASYHKYIAYSIRTAAPRLDAATPEGWNWRKMDCEKLNSFLTNTSICETDVGELHEAIDVLMPKKKPRGARKPVFWWSDEIAELRKSSLDSLTIAHILPTSKAPGQYGIPDAVIRAVALAWRTSAWRRDYSLAHGNQPDLCSSGSW